MSLLSARALAALKEKVRRVTENDLEEIQLQVERTNVFPDAYYDVCRKNDLFRLSIPEAFGGMGLNCEQFFSVMEEFCRGPGGMRMNLHHANGLNWRILHDHGAEDLRAKWLPKLANKDAYINFALTEADCGSGTDIRTTAVRKGDKYVLNGSKTLISHTDISDASYVIAVTDENKRKKGGLTAFFVETSTPGYYIDPMPHMMGCRGAGNAYLRFENCEVPAHNIMGQEGDGLDIFMNALAHSSAMIAVTCLGIFGGMGYFEDNPYGPVERMYRDARALWFEEGPRTLQRLTIIERRGVIQ